MFANRSLTAGVVRSTGADEPLLIMLNPDRVATALNSAPSPVRDKRVAAQPAIPQQA